MPTRRQAIEAALRRGGEWTLRDLSREVGAPEKDVADDLGHVLRSMRREGSVITIEPAACAACGFAFEDRDRTRRPSRCPACRSTRVRPARYRVGAE